MLSVSFSPNSGCTVWLLSQLSHAPAEHEEMWTQSQFSASRTTADIWAKTCKTAHLNEIFLLGLVDMWMTPQQQDGVILTISEDVAHDYIGYTEFARFFYARPPK